MHVLTVLESNTWADHHLAGSLEDMGHEVHRYFYGVGAGEFYGRKRSGEREEKNRQLLEMATQLKRDGRLDLIFCYVYDDFLCPAIARRLARLDVPMVNLNVDMVNQWYRQSRTARYFDRMLCAHHDNMDALQRHGGRPMYFPMAGRVPKKSDVEFQSAAAVTFVGTPAPYRKRVLSQLHQRQIPLAVYGKFWDQNRVAAPDRNWEKTFNDLWHYGWTRLRNEGAGRMTSVLASRLRGNEARNEARNETLEEGDVPQSVLHGFVPDGAMDVLFRDSKINLGMTRMIGEDPNVPGVCQVKLRDFEVPLAGGFYLVEEAPEYEQLFVSGKEVVTWRNPDDLADKIHYYLEHESERVEIAAAGRCRALKDHTWQARFSTLFAELGIGND